MNDQPRYFWTKVWSAPGTPGNEALAFAHEKTRDSVLSGIIKPGDIVVYLTSDAKEADPLMKGRVVGAVEIANKYRRKSQGEIVWSMYQTHDFQTVDAARAAEDHMLLIAKQKGYASPDHSEFLVGIGMTQLRELFLNAISVGSELELSAPSYLGLRQK